jgi:hypothetical protein
MLRFYYKISKSLKGMGTINISSTYTTYVNANANKLNFTDYGLITYLITVGKFVIISFYVLFGVLFRIAPYSTVIWVIGLLLLSSLLFSVLGCYYYFFYKNTSIEDEEISIKQFQKKLWSRWYIKFYVVFRFIVTDKSLKLSQLIYYRRFVLVRIIKKMIRNFGWDITKYYFKLYFSNMHLFKISWNLDQIESLLYCSRPSMRDALVEPDEFFNLKGEMTRTETKHLVGNHWVAESTLDKELDIVDNFFCVRDVEWLEQIGAEHVYSLNLEAERQYQQNIARLQRKKSRFSKYYASFIHLLIHYYLMLIIFYPKYYVIEDPVALDPEVMSQFNYFEKFIDFITYNFCVYCISFRQYNTYITHVKNTKGQFVLPTTITEKESYFPPIFKRKGRFIRKGFSDLRGANSVTYKTNVRHLRQDVMFHFRSKAHVRFFKRWLYWRADFEIFPWKGPERRVPCYYQYMRRGWDRYKTGYQMELDSSGRRHYATYRLDELGGDLMQEFWAYGDAAPALKDAAVHLAFDGRLLKNEFNKDMLFWYAKRSRVYKGGYNLRYKRFDHLDWYNFKKYIFRRTFYQDHSINYILRKSRMFYKRTSFRNYYALPEIVTYDNTALDWYVAEINEEGPFFVELYRWIYYTNFFNIHRLYKNRMDLGYRYGYSTPDRWYVKAKNYSFTDARYERTWSDRKNELLIRNSANFFREPIPIGEMTCENIDTIIIIISIYFFLVGTFILVSRRVQIALQEYLVWVILIFLFFILHIIQQYFGMSVVINQVNHYCGKFSIKYILLPLWLQYLEMDDFWHWKADYLWFFVTNMCI